MRLQNLLCFYSLIIMHDLKSGRDKSSLHVGEHGGSFGGQTMRIEHTNLRFVPCTLGGESNAPANGRTFFGPISIDKPPAEISLQFGCVQAVGQTISGRSVSIIAGQPNARTCRGLRAPQAIRGASTDRPYLPLPEARHHRLQTSYAFQSSPCAGKRDPTLRAIGAYTDQECECFGTPLNQG
jgi:hypothetical protein